MAGCVGHFRNIYSGTVFALESTDQKEEPDHRSSVCKEQEAVQAGLLVLWSLKRGNMFFSL